MVYDAQNNIVSVTDPAGQTTTMTYDAVGNMLTQTNSLNKTTTFQYNALNQLVQITDPKGNVTGYTYDHNGNPLSATDANSRITQYLYNYKDKLTRITDALNNVTNLFYGGAGCSSCGGGVDKLTAVIDARNRATSFEYDLIGSLVKETDPLGKKAAYTYDSKKNLLTTTSPDDKTITFSYDLNNRLTRKTYSDGSVTTFEYDDAGNLTYAGNTAIAYNFAYDAVNRLTGITDSNNRTIQYQYDAAGNRTQMITPDGRTITYGYNDNGLTTRITTNLGDFNFTYDAANRRITRSHPNGITSTYSYDDNSNLTGITTAKDGITLDSVAYTHDPVGNRITKALPEESWTYSYDPVYRLTQAVPTGGIHPPEAYTYDAVGNRLTGQEPQSPAENENTQYGYDDENRLTNVRITKGEKIRELNFSYDPFGRRITKTIVSDGIGTECTAPNTCPRTTHYVYDGPNIIAEYNQSGDILARYTHAPGIDEPLAVEVKNGMTFIPYHYHADGLGSITALSDRQGGTVQRYAYDSFGSITVTTQGSISQPYAFTGREYDVETGMYFYRARYYDPKAGRFVTKDPIGFNCGDVNLYGYVLNDPVNWIDPTGLAGCYVSYPGYPITIPGTSITVPLNHGGVLSYNDQGQTRYYEYGRYDSDYGNVRRRTVPDLELGPDGRPTLESWAKLQEALKKIGNGKKAATDCNEKADANKINKYAEQRKNDPKRAPYSWNPFKFNTCTTFGRDALGAGLK